MKCRHLTSIVTVLLTLCNGFKSEAQEWTSEKKLLQSLLSYYSIFAIKHVNYAQIHSSFDYRCRILLFSLHS